MLPFTVFAASENAAIHGSEIAEMLLFAVFAASEKADMRLFTVSAKPRRATRSKKDRPKPHLAGSGIVEVPNRGSPE